MKRRDFLRNAGLGAAVLTTAPMFPALTFTDEQRARNARVHILGMPVVDTAQMIVKQMSDDVFDRVLAAVQGLSFRLSGDERTGMPGMTDQWNNSIVVDEAYGVRDPLVFDLDRFRRRTAGWMRGPMMCPAQFDSPGVPPADAFHAGVTTVGMPFLPDGLMWAAHYLDESTGFAMRALAQLDIATDTFTIRWDVLCG